jgi:hypothetical protein
MSSLGTYLRHRPFLTMLALGALLVGLPLSVFAAWLGVQAALAGSPAALAEAACPLADSARIATLRQQEVELRRRLAELESDFARRRAWCPVCAAAEEVDVAVVVDTSLSMRYPATLDAAGEAALMQRIEREAGPLDTQPGRDRLMAELNAAAPAQQRMEAARRAALAALDQMPARARVQLFSFGSPNPAAANAGQCAVAPVGQFDNAARQRLQAALRGLQPDAQGTPLALSIERAAAAVRQRPAGVPGFVVIVTDGVETCRGDPCAAARTARAADPGLTISVVDIAANRQLSCLAEATGGRIVTPDAGGDVGRELAEALRVPPPRACIPRRS